MSDSKRAKRVNIGDAVEVSGGSGLAVLPSGMVVTCRKSYTVQHAGRHVIGGVVYMASDPAKVKVKATPVTPDQDPADQDGDQDPAADPDPED